MHDGFHMFVCYYGTCRLYRLDLSVIIDDPRFCDTHVTPGNQSVFPGLTPHCAISQGGSELHRQQPKNNFPPQSSHLSFCNEQQGDRAENRARMLSKQIV